MKREKKMKKEEYSKGEIFLAMITLAIGALAILGVAKLLLYFTI